VDYEVSGFTRDRPRGASGAEFDKEYLAAVVSSHKTCVSAFEDISKESKDTDVKAFADKTLPALKAHHDKAKELHSK
jgi:putative membrane protein